ncbi:hypothetical protein T484DRAFT_1778474, partial [Baffinella frigidus]
GFCNCDTAADGSYFRNTITDLDCDAKVACNGACTDAERCDDGGTAPNDGCSATCTIESGYDCQSGNATQADVCVCATG